jgi:hypothetical protein
MAAAASASMTRSDNAGSAGARKRETSISASASTVGDFWANVSRGRHGLYAGGRITRLSAEGRLDEPLISQNVRLAAGLPVEAYTQFDWYRLGYRHTFPWAWGDKTIEFYPCIGATALDFQYTLSSLELGMVDRSYVKFGVQAGLGMTWPLGERLSLTGQLLAPIPFSRAPEILSAQVALQYRFPQRAGVSISGLCGIGYDRISYTDGQAVPNDIEADLGPMGLLSLEIRF